MPSRQSFSTLAVDSPHSQAIVRPYLPKVDESQAILRPLYRLKADDSIIIDGQALVQDPEGESRSNWPTIVRLFISSPSECPAGRFFPPYRIPRISGHLTSSSTCLKLMHRWF
jgi:hypothetical protein